MKELYVAAEVELIQLQCADAITESDELPGVTIFKES